jgi:hypothetical protein
MISLKELASKVGLKIFIRSSERKEFTIQGSFVHELDRKFNRAYPLKVM